MSYDVGWNARSGCPEIQFLGVIFFRWGNTFSQVATYRCWLGSNFEATCHEMNLQPLTLLPWNKGSEFSHVTKEAKNLGLALVIPLLGWSGGSVSTVRIAKFNIIV